MKTSPLSWAHVWKSGLALTEKRLACECRIFTEEWAPRLSAVQGILGAFCICPKSLQPHFPCASRFAPTLATPGLPRVPSATHLPAFALWFLPSKPLLGCVCGILSRLPGPSEAASCHEGMWALWESGPHCGSGSDWGRASC